MSKLACADIKEGAFLWVNSIGGRNFPAHITRIDEKTRTFYIMSLDDMSELSQPFDCDSPPNAPESCTEMRSATPEEVDDYLGKQEEALIEKVAMTRRVGAQSALTLHRFRAVRDKLFPEHVEK